MVSNFTNLQCAPEPKDSLHDMLESYTIEEEYRFGGVLGNKTDTKEQLQEQEEQLKNDVELPKRDERSSSLSEADTFTKRQLKRRDSSFKYEDYKKDMYSRGQMFN